MATGIWFHGKMDPLVPLEVVVAVEALDALIALEGPIIWRLLLLRVVVHATIDLLNAGCVTAVETSHHAAVQATYKGELTAGVLYV